MKTNTIYENETSIGTWLYLDLERDGEIRKIANIVYDLSGAADVTIEGSPDVGDNWIPMDTISEGGATSNFKKYTDVGFRLIRAKVSANLNNLWIVGRK